jgi:HIV-1 Vpr-binding protein
VLLSLAEGDVLADADVQKAAINVIINSVCGPVTRVSAETFRNVTHFVIFVVCF